MKNIENAKHTTLVLGATGKTGSRIVARLNALGVPTRVGSRSAGPAFDWNDSSNWDQVLSGVTNAYVNFAPDLAIPGAQDSIRQFIDLAIEKGVKRVVLLSGRGEEEAQRCEEVIQRDDLEWTVVRASWFAQNFSEGEFMEMVMSGHVVLPAGNVKNLLLM